MLRSKIADAKAAGELRPVAEQPRKRRRWDQTSATEGEIPAKKSSWDQAEVGAGGWCRRAGPGGWCSRGGDWWVVQ